MTAAAPVKENIYLGLAYRGLVHYHHGGKHGNVQGPAEAAESSTSELAGSRKRK